MKVARHMPYTLPDKSPTVIRRFSDSQISALIALCPGAILLWHLGWPLGWPALLLPASVMLFTFVWARGMIRYLGRPLALISGLILGAGLAHLMIWLPFLMVVFSSGQGGRLGYSALAALVTAGAVGWFILGQYLWQTVLFCAALVGVLYVMRHRRAGGKA